MNAQLQDLVERLLYCDPPETDSDDSVSFKAHREAETVADWDVLKAAKEEVTIEKDKKRRDALYFVICKVALQLNDAASGGFLVQQLHRESDKYVLMSLLDRISELRKPKKTDISPILTLLGDKRELVRLSAIAALSGAESPDAETALIQILDTNADSRDIVCANAALSQSGTPRAIPAIERNLGGRVSDINGSARFAIKAIQERHKGQQDITPDR